MTQPRPIKEDFQFVLNFLKKFIRAPIEGLRFEPQWDYRTSFIFLFLTSEFSGFLSGLYPFSLDYMITWMILLPIISLVIALLITFGTSVLIRFVHGKNLPLQGVFQVVVISLLPFLFLRFLMNMAPPIKLIGVAGTCAFLIVGLSERFYLPRRSIIKIISVAFGIYALYWCVDIIRHSRFNKAAGQNITEDSRRLLEAEFGEQP